MILSGNVDSPRDDQGEFDIYCYERTNYMKDQIQGRDGKEKTVKNVES